MIPILLEIVFFVKLVVLCFMLQRHNIHRIAPQEVLILPHDSNVDIIYRYIFVEVQSL